MRKNQPTLDIQFNGIAYIRLGNSIDSVQLSQGLTKAQALEHASQVLNDALREIEDEQEKVGEQR